MLSTGTSEPVFSTVGVFLIIIPLLFASVGIVLRLLTVKQPNPDTRNLMSNPSSIRILKATNDATDRVLSRLVGLQDGYLFILVAIKNHLNGDKELKKHIESLELNLASSGMNAVDHFLSILFLDLISEIEIYFSHLIKAVLAEHPKKLASTTFKLGEILDAESVDELIMQAADDYLYKLMYNKPLEYLQSMCEVLSIDRNKMTDLWKAYVEAKARRDLGVHNRWKCNSTYLRKLREAGIVTTAQIGESMFPKYHNYVADILQQLSDLTKQMAEEMYLKYGNVTTGTLTEK